MMIFTNEVYKINKLPRDYAEGFVKLISCIAPHIGEEMWEKLGHKETIAFASWPKYDESKLVVNTIKIGVSVNGKPRATIEVGVDASEEEIKAIALKEEGVLRHTEGKEIKKIIVVKGKIINIVAI